MENVTAVILNFNNSDDCKKCINFLKKQDYKYLNIVIVDNKSTMKDEVEKLEHIVEGQDVKLIFNDENRGFSAGNNIGLKFAVDNGADWCLVINPDVELRESNYISYVIEQSKKWKDSVVIGTNMILPTGTRQNPQRESSFWEEFLWPIQSLKSKIKKDFNWYLTYDKTGYCEKLCGGCFFIKAEFLKKINYLDENVFMYCEEAILSKLVEKYNKKELYLKEVTSYHEHYAAKKSPSKQRMNIFFNSRNYYIDNYSGYNLLKKKALKFSLKLQKLYVGEKK